MNITATNTTTPIEEVVSFFITVSVSSVMFLIFIIYSLAVFILSCILRKKQPLKSRGFTYIGLLAALFIGGVLTVLKSIIVAILPSFRNIVNCYMDLFGVMPAIIVYFSILIARNVRFIFVININKLKNLIFGNTKVSELLKEKELVKKKKQPNRKSTIGTKRKSVANTEESNSAQQSPTPTTVETPSSPSPESETTTAVDVSPNTNVDSDETMSNADEVAQYFDVQVESKALKRLRFLKFMTSYWVTFVIVAIVVILWYLFAVQYKIISLGNDPNCHMVSPGIAFGFSGVLYLISFGILVLDLLLHGRDLVKCRLHYLFCRHDKFLFHIEYLIIFVTNVAIVVHAILAVYIPEYDNWVNKQYAFVGSFFVFLIGYATIFSLAGFVLLVTIVWECNGRRKRKQNKQDNNLSGSDQLLESVMRDTKLQIMFREFCEQEWSLENFLCYQDITLWIRRAKQSIKLKTAIQIYEKFMKPACSLEINLPNYARDKAKVVVQNISLFMEKQHELTAPPKMQETESSQEIIIQAVETSSNMEDYPQLVKAVEEVFVLVLKEVKANLNDTLYRFILTPSFQQHMDAAELKDNILENA